MAAPDDQVSGISPAHAGFALLFGGVLGLALWKFGNPVILDARFTTPQSLGESQPWPPRWGLWCLLPVALLGLGPAWARRFRVFASPWLWALPLAWFAWQLAAAARSVDGTLTALTLPQLGGCLLCYFLGLWGLGTDRAFRLLLIGLLAAFAVCLVRASHQQFFEFPQDKRTLLEGERTGWTNFAPEAIAQMKSDGVIITTNGLDKLSPMIRQKYDKARAYGTLIYPNGLAGAVLLLLPVTLTAAVAGTRGFRPLTRYGAIGLAVFLGLGSLLWSGSKSGWLIALGVAGVAAFRRPWPVRWKWAGFLVLMVLGLTAFGLRFRQYFASGATSVGARFDYWRAASRNTSEHPWFGSGPGTFQRPYARLNRPESEMARLAHNDYLEQFSDSGIPGGVTYVAWIALLLATIGRQAWREPQPLRFAVFLGLLGWFVQGFTEFGLYIPALAWPAFALAGSLLNPSQAAVRKAEQVFGAVGHAPTRTSPASARRG